MGTHIIVIFAFLPIWIRGFIGSQLVQIAQSTKYKMKVKDARFPLDHVGSKYKYIN